MEKGLEERKYSCGRDDSNKGDDKTEVKSRGGEDSCYIISKR